MKLHFVINRRVPDRPSPVLVEVFDRLRREGHQVEAAIPEECLVRPDLIRPEADLYVLKSHTEFAFSFAGALHAAGAELLNPYGSWVATQDKIVVSRYLKEAGIPTPRSWITSDLSLLASLVEDGPLIVKPHRGHRGAGIHIARTAEDLAAIEIGESPVIVQEHVTGPGEDLKVYVVGDDVYAVRKPFSPTSFSVPGRPCPVGEELAEISRRCGQVLGLGLYGLDVIESPDGPVVVDVNTFPGYKGVPDPAPAIASYILAFARGEVSLASPGGAAVPAAA
ncbi:MAG TPA: ATP-grasp domain-containing protein [Egibacteraceae bacterium]|nr:ATP-grasp domain-containing protein [Egibacteraceae bacterium]